MNIPMEQRPVVAIIYSEGDRFSAESRNMAWWMAAQLGDLGCCIVHLVGVSPDGIPTNSLNQGKKERIVFMGSWNGKKVEVPAGDINHSHFDMLNTAHVVIVMVNSSETYMCVEKMKQQLGQSSSVGHKCTIFSLQRGVRNNEAVREAFTGRKDLAIVEGIAGFAVVYDERHKAYVPTEAYPAIVLERLSKEVADIANGPCNLLENTGLYVNYRKTLTTYAWGMLIWETIHCLSGMTGQTVMQTLLNPRCRLILASTFREASVALETASRGGDWRADLLLIHPFITPRMVEMWLCLPTFFFRLVGWCLTILPPHGLYSNVAFDLQNGRKSTLSASLGELCATGKVYGVEMPVSEQLQRQVLALEPGEGKARADLLRKPVEEMLDVLEREAVIYDGLPPSAENGEKDTRKRLKIGQKSLREFRRWLLKAFSVGGVVLLLYLLFVHEHEFEEALEFTEGHHDQEML